MANKCLCDGKYGNTGKGDCRTSSQFAPMATGVLVPLFKSDGTRYSFTAEEIIQLKTWQDSFVEEHVKDRTYPLVKMTGVTNIRDEGTYETFSNNVRNYLIDGKKTLMADLINFGPVYLEQLQKFFKNDAMGMFPFDVEGNMRFLDCCGDGKFYPVPLNMYSWVPQLVDSEDTASQKLTLSVDWNITAKDWKLRTLVADNFEFDPLVEFENAGLIDAEYIASEASTTTVNIRITDTWGCGLTGLDLVNDFVFTNKTQSQVEAVTSIESTTEEGLYAVTYGTPVTLADVIVLTSLVPIDGVNSIDYSGFANESYTTGS
jgi:hypothetical protein